MTKQKLIAQHNQQVLQLRENEFDAKVDTFVDTLLVVSIAYMAFHIINYFI